MVDVVQFTQLVSGPVRFPLLAKVSARFVDELFARVKINATTFIPGAVTVEIDSVDGLIVIDDNPTITGTGDELANVEVFIDAASQGSTIIAGGIWSLPVTLNPGDNSILAVATIPSVGSGQDIIARRLFDYDPDDLTGIFSRSGIAFIGEIGSAVILRFAIDVARMFGDRSVLIESTRLNQVQSTVDESVDPPWRLLGSASVTNNAAIDPEGNLLADRLTLPDGGQVTQFRGVGLGQPQSKSAYYQAEGSPIRLGVGGSGFVQFICIDVQADVWKRIEFFRGTLSIGNFTQINNDPPCTPSVGTISVLTKFPQMEAGTMSTSHIENLSDTVGVLRAPDISEHPTWFDINISPWTFRCFAGYSSVDASNNFTAPVPTELNFRTLFGVGVVGGVTLSDLCTLEGVATDAVLKLTLQSVLVLTVAVSFPFPNDLSIRFDNVAGTVTLSGFTTGNGVSAIAPWVWRTGVFSPGRSLFVGQGQIGFLRAFRPIPS